MIKRLDIFVVINIYSFCILHIFYKQGFEWSVLKAMTKLSHSQLPLQIYAELHLNRDAANNELVQGQYVGTRLRHFFDELFLKSGYMIMHARNTLQSKNMDVLFSKVFCSEDE